MKYCKNCLMPETKPDLAFNEEGKCSACIAFEERDNVEWMVKYKKPKINSFLQTIKDNYRYQIVEKFPSITIFYKDEQTALINI